MSLNMVMLQGALGQDADVKALQGGRFVMNLSIPTSESWTTESGEKKERTDWHNCTQYFRESPRIAPYLTKGKAIMILGKHRHESYEKDGEKKFRDYIQIERIEFVTGHSGKQSGGSEEGDAGGGSGRSESRGSGGGYAKSGGGNSRPAQTSIPIDDVPPDMGDSDLPF